MFLIYVPLKYKNIYIILSALAKLIVNKMSISLMFSKHIYLLVHLKENTRTISFKIFTEVFSFIWNVTILWYVSILYVVFGTAFFV